MHVADSVRHDLESGELHRRRHVCCVVDGRDDLYRTLLPYVAEGIERGERALHIVDPADRSDHLARLESGGIDVGRLLDTGQLEVRTWLEFYVRDGRFDPDATAALFKSELARGRSLGFTGTRGIGRMEWIFDDVPGVETIVRYEADLDAAWPRSRDSVICAYDVRRHRARLIFDVLAVHPYAVIDGRLASTRAAHMRPRDRILEAASRLFHRKGIGATGVDTLIASAGVAKATFYKQFASKEDLVVAWLQDPRTRWFDRVSRSAEARAASAGGLFRLQVLLA